jgi:hypothetical protein
VLLRRDPSERGDARQWGNDAAGAGLARSCKLVSNRAREGRNQKRASSMSKDFETATSSLYAVYVGATGALKP